MKISRIIFISYFSIIGLFLVSLTIMGFVHKDKSLTDVFSSETHETVEGSLESFKYVVVGENCEVNITNSDRSVYTFYTEKNRKPEHPTLEVRNDTLFVRKTPKRTTISTKKLNLLSGTGCDIRLEDLRQDALKIKVEKSKIRMWQNVDIKRLDVRLSEASKLGGWNLQVEQLFLDVNNSELNCRVDKRLKEINGNVSNHSNIRLTPANRITLDVDESSRINMN